MLAHRSIPDLEAAGLRLMLDTTPSWSTRRSASSRSKRQPALTTSLRRAGDQHRATPVVPRLPGIDLPGVHVLHTIDEARTMRAVVDAGARTSALIGAGYIGTEMADAFALAASR